MTIPPPHSGFRFVPGYLDRPAQEALLSALRSVLAAAPAYTPRMPKSGKPLSVRMTNCGPLGWVTDEAGYRYQALHPETGQPWPAMPGLVVEAWKALARYPHAPESCLVNYYGPAAKMGLHQDRDERDLGAPVVSLSLGDTCLFRIGGTKRSDPTRSLRLASGDAVVLAGEARLAFHGVDRIIPGTSTLLPEGGRINLTLRRVTVPTDGTSAPNGRRMPVTAFSVIAGPDPAIHLLRKSDPAIHLLRESVLRRKWTRGSSPPVTPENGKR